MGVVAIAIGIIPAAIIGAVILIIVHWDKIVSMFNNFITFIQGVGAAISNALIGGFFAVINFILGGIAKLIQKWTEFKSNFKMPSLGGLLSSATGILGFQKGGYVTGSGLAMVHKGETIIPSGGGNTNNKQINNSITMNVGNIAGVEDDFAASLGPTLMNELGRFTT